MDRIWSYLGEMKLPGMNTARFLRIAKVANVILIISHSNAGEEQVFSSFTKSEEMTEVVCSFKELCLHWLLLN